MDFYATLKGRRQTEREFAQALKNGTLIQLKSLRISKADPNASATDGTGEGNGQVPNLNPYRRAEARRARLALALKQSPELVDSELTIAQDLAQ
jgi:hypothetical protein